ncbi:hypothetical protein [Flammeovirga aprica]|uniref:Major capsid protein n=1 Tax=Flammeovirga aprica JL-4 TaxID=694437 RepID=A0A7X9P0I4_9BACT|nr:hypothetical protein [Flammeovirga aprica]NME67195.1 hypothetical protein [Flammeovirga aprica JL-4]
MDISTFGSEMKRYYTQNQAMIDIELMGMGDAPSVQQCRPIAGVQDRYLGKGKRLEKILQPGMKGFTPLVNKLAVHPHETVVRDAKIDYSIDYDDLRRIQQSIIGYLTAGRRSNVNQQSVQSIYNETLSSIISAKARETEMDIFWRGQFLAPTYPTPGAAADVVDGVKKVLTDAITAGTLAPSVQGAYDNTTTLDYADTFADSLPDSLVLSYPTLPIYCSPTFHKDAFYNRRSKYGGNNDYNSKEIITVGALGRCYLVPLLSMSSESRLWTTLPGNLIWCSNYTGEDKMLTVTTHEDEREVRITGDYKIAPGFEFIGVPSATNDTQIVWVTDWDKP